MRQQISIPSLRRYYAFQAESTKKTKVRIQIVSMFLVVCFLGIEFEPHNSYQFSIFMLENYRDMPKSRFCILLAFDPRDIEKEKLQSCSKYMIFLCTLWNLSDDVKVSCGFE